MKNKPFRGFSYIDLFAGPGKNLLRESGRVVLGSPLIALVQPRPFTSYYLVEKDPRYFDALLARSQRIAIEE